MNRPMPPIKHIIQCDLDLIEMKIDLCREIYNYFLPKGWDYVEANSLVSWGIADYMRLHRVNLGEWDNEGNSVRRHRRQNQDSAFEDCIAQFLRACINLWEKEERKRTKQKNSLRIRVEVQKQFEKSGTRNAFRPDIYIFSEDEERRGVAIECKSGQGYSRGPWEDGKWKETIDKEREHAAEFLLHGFKYYKFVLYLPDVFQKKSTEKSVLEKMKSEMEKKGVFILLAKTPNDNSYDEYLKARKETSFFHGAEPLFSKVREDLTCL